MGPESILLLKRRLASHVTMGRDCTVLLKEVEQINNPEYSLEGLLLEAPILWPPNVKSQLFGKDSDTGKD